MIELYKRIDVSIDTMAIRTRICQYHTVDTFKLAHNSVCVYVVNGTVLKLTIKFLWMYIHLLFFFNIENKKINSSL